MTSIGFDTLAYYDEYYLCSVRTGKSRHVQNWYMSAHSVKFEDPNGWSYSKLTRKLKGVNVKFNSEKLRGDKRRKKILRCDLTKKT